MPAAYISGHTAKITPLAVINQVWLPSQVLPIALMTTRRSPSVLPMNDSSMHAATEIEAVGQGKANQHTPTKPHQITFSVS